MRNVEPYGLTIPPCRESPFTIDAGHAQVEMDVVSATQNRRDGGRATSTALAPFNLRVGLAQNCPTLFCIGAMDRAALTDIAK